MKTLMLALSVSLLLSPSWTSAQENQGKQEPQFKLIQFHMALIKKGPNWSNNRTEAKAQLEDQHVAYLNSLLESGKAIIGGRLADNGDIRGVFIFRAPSAEEAKLWAETSPAVEAGHLIAEMHPWWSEDIFKKPNFPMNSTRVYLGFLTRGAKWTPEKTAATEELQKAHIANIQRLAKLGKIVAAGPFGDDGNLRGIFVFRVASLEEAQTLAATDPSVQAGRLVIALHPWQVPEGVLP